MINVEVGMVINHPIEDVSRSWLTLNLPKWDTDFQEAKRVASTPDGVGATYQCVLKYTGKNATQKVETTEYAVNKKITFESAHQDCKGQDKYPVRVRCRRHKDHFTPTARILRSLQVTRTANGWRDPQGSHSPFEQLKATT
jgi:hypothetical protein